MFKVTLTSISSSAALVLFLATGLATAATDGKDHPCRALRKAAIDACSSAKFGQGKQKEHKGLFKDCVRPIMDGKAVEGVTVDATLVQGCQTRKAARSDKSDES